MLTLTESTIRSSFVNASRKEVAVASLPPDLGSMTEEDFAELDLLAWRDAT